MNFPKTVADVVDEERYRALVQEWAAGNDAYLDEGDLWDKMDEAVGS